MIITTEIQNKLKPLFSQFVEMTKLSNKSKGYFEMTIVGETVTYTLYDKLQNDNTKVIIWTQSFDLSPFADFESMKKVVSPMLEKEIREFCKL